MENESPLDNIIDLADILQRKTAIAKDISKLMPDPKVDAIGEVSQPILIPDFQVLRMNLIKKLVNYYDNAKNDAMRSAEAFIQEINELAINKAEIDIVNAWNRNLIAPVALVLNFEEMLPKVPSVLATPKIEALGTVTKKVS